ncbi:MAG: hypothetical protein ACPHY7_00595 [Gammaproteobacteria bacterium]
MANTTFSGPVRSQNGFEKISKNGTTGLVSDVTQDYGVKDARRQYLCENFQRRPQLNASIGVAANLDFEILGTNAADVGVTFPSTTSGINIATAGADQDQIIIAPHLDTDQTAWTGTKWGTENQTQWECSILLPALDNQKVWAGLKLTNDQLISTDADQVFFKYQTDATNSESFTDFTKWHFVHSIGGTDFISQLPITATTNTPYHFKIIIDKDRKATIFVNGVQYNVTTTSGSTGGTAVTSVAPGQVPVKTGALTNDVDFIPYIGIEAGAAAAESLTVQYQNMNREHFENIII